MPALDIGDEGILRESRSGQGSQDEWLNNGTKDGYVNLLGDPGALTGAATASRSSHSAKKVVAEDLRGDGLVGVVNLQREGRRKSLGDRGLERRRRVN
jgi:hypothetical protein